MKKKFLAFVSYSCLALLVAFAIVLCSQALQGNPYAIALLIWEMADVVIPFVVNEAKMPKWIGNLWILSIGIWFVCAFIWTAFLIFA